MDDILSEKSLKHKPIAHADCVRIVPTEWRVCSISYQTEAEAIHTGIYYTSRILAKILGAYSIGFISTQGYTYTGLQQIAGGEEHACY